MALVRHVPRSGRRPARAVAAALAMLLAVALLVPGLPLGDPTASAAEAPARRMVSGWLPSWSASASLAAVEGNADVFSEASPFWHTVRASREVTRISTAADSATVAKVVSSLRARGIRVIPSVADGSPARSMAAVLADNSARRKHVAQLVALVQANRYDGIELDYEKFAFADGASTWARTRRVWVAFIAELGAALHARGKRLAVAAPPIYNGKRGRGSGYWVYDFAGIAASVDSLRIMTYDYSVSRPGPISPLSFIRRSLDYAVKVFPSERIRVGLPAYGRLWTARKADGSPARTGKCPRSGVPGTRSFTTAKAVPYLTAKAGRYPDIRYDKKTAEQVATFRVKYRGKDSKGRSTSCTVKHEAWWIDARGVSARMAFVKEYRLGGVAIWHLSGVDEASWTTLRAYARSVAPKPTSVTLAVPAKRVVGVSVPVSVKVASKAKLAKGTKVTLQRRSRGSAKWQTVGAKPMDRSGRAAFKVPGLSASSHWRATVPGTWHRAAGLGQASTSVSPRVATKVSTSKPQPGARVRLTVRVTPARAGIVVKRRMLVDGRWKTMDEARTSAKGKVTFVIKWPRGQVRHRYQVVTARTSRMAAGRSPEFVIKTR
ncbi:MAG: glycosyl hydrolase family 18 protein [Candidatus Nanopelagicales bacterium]